MEDVTLKQEIFCQAWVDTIGNGTMAAIQAFDIADKELLELNKKDLSEENRIKWEKAYKLASSMGTEYLRKPSVIKRIDEILDERGFVDSIVKQEHFKLIKTSDETVKMRAIDSYYKLKGKIIDKAETTLIAPEPIMQINVRPNDGNKQDNSTDKED